MDEGQNLKEIEEAEVSQEDPVIDEDNSNLIQTFQLHVVDYPPPLEIVSLTQDQALLILHSRLPSNCV